jgi:hypothetical protein
VLVHEAGPNSDPYFFSKKIGANEPGRHQEKALYFMLQRENGPIDPEFRLWKAMDGGNEGW